MQVKRKFHDTPPSLYEHEQEFTQEILFISKMLGINKNRIEIDGDNAFGEDVIFVDSVYSGYLDDGFYDFMLHGIDEYGDYADWLALFQRDYQEEY